MFLHSRRFSVWLVSFLAVLVIYLVYNRMSRRPLIQAGDLGRSGGIIVDVCDSNGQVGMVGDVGVGKARNVRYTMLNDQKQVVGEFGFAELLHQDANDWDLEKPYYTIYRPGFKCELKGDRARVVVETAGNRVTPKKGKLTGNVTIRIFPRRAGGPGEGVIYLDDIVFEGDKSLFSTDGPVEYDSDDAQLVGKGMELVYDSAGERLEFLKIAQLESLHIKRWSRGTVFAGQTETTSEPGPAEKNTDKSDFATAAPDKSGQRYKCLLDKNVVVETAQERLMAQVLSISDISAGGESEDEAGGPAPKGQGGQETGESAGSAVGRQSTASAQKAGDVMISCDGSILIVPMDSAMDLNQPPPAPTEARRFDTKADEKTTFYGQRIDYNASTGTAVATGSSKISFDVNNTGRQAGTGPTQVTVTSQKQAKFEPASNKVSFEGDCRCIATQKQVDVDRQYIVLADNLDVYLAQKQGDENGPSLDIKRFVAAGGIVHLAGTKKAGERLLTGVELKCTRIDYDAVEDKFAATGPGLIMMDNSQTDEPQKGLGRFSLRRKAYAFLRNFDSLEFDRGNNHLVAYSKDGSMLADFIPVGEGSRKDKVAVTASRVEADITETAEGRAELEALVAKGAVSYEDKDIQCTGSEFVYDADGPAISLRGDKSRPCIFNGAIVDSAWRDPKTGKWKTRLKAPGAIK